MFNEHTRSEIARILEVIASEGLSQPRDLDVALDAIEAIIEAQAPEL